MRHSWILLAGMLACDSADDASGDGSASGQENSLSQSLSAQRPTTSRDPWLSAAIAIDGLTAPEIVKVLQAEASARATRRTWEQNGIREIQFKLASSFVQDGDSEKTRSLVDELLDQERSSLGNESKFALMFLG
ncbi:MAG: hypothetical protein QGG40_13170, partial [Myxococcota bacterium]|nr:hypothetical protein [Myxococcota bacterium]